MKEYTLKASGAQTDSTTGDAVSIENDNHEVKFTRAIFVLDVTALATATGDKLDVFIDVSFDGSKWHNAVHFTQMDGDGSAATEVAILSNNQLLNDPDAIVATTADLAETVTRNLGVAPYVRYRSTITDVTTDDASFTYSVKAFFD